MQKSDYIFGIHALLEALEADVQIDKVLIKKDLDSATAHTLREQLRERRIPVQYVPIERLNRITRRNHQGVIATVTPVTYQHITDIIPAIYERGETPLILILDGLTDTRNFGAIARTAECAGVHAIVIPERGSVSATPDAVKTSAGALLHIPVCREPSLPDTAEYLAQCGCNVVAATEKASDPYTSVPMQGPTAIVMGAEDTGISPAVLRHCQYNARIPICGHIGSLNVSVAAAVMLYEVLRQRDIR